MDNIDSSNKRVACLFCKQLDDLIINFGATLENSTFTLYGQALDYVWMQGTLKRIAGDDNFLLFDDSSRQIYIDISSFKLSQLSDDSFIAEQKASILCKISIVAIGDEAHPYFKLKKLSRLENPVNPVVESVWNHKVILWYLKANKAQKISPNPLH